MVQLAFCARTPFINKKITEFERKSKRNTKEIKGYINNIAKKHSTSCVLKYYISNINNDINDLFRKKDEFIAQLNKDNTKTTFLGYVYKYTVIPSPSIVIYVCCYTKNQEIAFTLPVIDDVDSIKLDDFTIKEFQKKELQKFLDMDKYFFDNTIKKNQFAKGHKPAPPPLTSNELKMPSAK